MVKCTESSTKVSTMREQELRARLQRALHTRISESEWRRLKKTGLVGGYQRGTWTWEEFRGFVSGDLAAIRDFAEDLRREQAGELPLEAEITESTPEPTDVTDDIPAPLSDRTAARARALSALDRLHSGPPWDRVSREISSKVRPRGGFDNRLPQWVIELNTEAWVPADDVRSIYQHVQRDLLVEDACPKTHPRTFNVARFVWAEELRHGKRPSWPVLFERWKEQNPGDESFEDWRAFRTCFKRGEKATPPRYKDSNDYIASEARRLRQLKERWEEGPRFGLRPY
jgi:hypothetical protein